MKTYSKIFAILACLLVSVSAGAQGNIPQLVGNIKNLEGIPIPKIKISTKHGRAHAKTDKLGNFSFSNVNADDTLLVAYNDVITEVAIRGRSKISMKLAGDFADLIRKPAKEKKEEEMIDTGFGKVKKNDYSGGTSSLTAEDIKKAGFKSLADAVSSMGALVDSDGEVKVRSGFNSFNGKQTALLMCDDNEISSLYDIEINDVASIEILKDGDLYGVRGANGVVVIRTKVN